MTPILARSLLLNPGPSAVFPSSFNPLALPPLLSCSYTRPPCSASPPCPLPALPPWVRQLSSPPRRLFLLSLRAPPLIASTSATPSRFKELSDLPPLAFPLSPRVAASALRCSSSSRSRRCRRTRSTAGWLRARRRPRGQSSPPLVPPLQSSGARRRGRPRPGGAPQRPRAAARRTARPRGPAARSPPRRRRRQQRRRHRGQRQQEGSPGGGCGEEGEEG